jgi:hypothetical protein
LAARERFEARGDERAALAAFAFPDADSGPAFEIYEVTPTVVASACVLFHTGILPRQD